VIRQDPTAAREGQAVGARDSAHCAHREPRRRSTDARPNKLSAFDVAAKQALTADAQRPKHERRTARPLHAEVKAEVTAAATRPSPPSFKPGAKARGNR